MKLFGKYEKKINVNDFDFYCVINETPSNEHVSIKIFSSKTSFFEILFSWQITYFINLHRPNTCAKLIKYAIEYGWDYKQDRNSVKIEQGDFLVKELDLEL
jgi:hypothetical protein